MYFIIPKTIMTTIPRLKRFA